MIKLMGNPECQHDTENQKNGNLRSLHSLFSAKRIAQNHCSLHDVADVQIRPAGHYASQAQHGESCNGEKKSSKGSSRRSQMPRC